MTKIYIWLKYYVVSLNPNISTKNAKTCFLLTTVTLHIPCDCLEVNILMKTCSL